MSTLRCPVLGNLAGEVRLKNEHFFRFMLECFQRDGRIYTRRSFTDCCLCLDFLSSLSDELFLKRTVFFQAAIPRANWGFLSDVSNQALRRGYWDESDWRDMWGINRSRIKMSGRMDACHEQAKNTSTNLVLLARESSRSRWSVERGPGDREWYQSIQVLTERDSNGSNDSFNPNLVIEMIWSIPQKTPNFNQFFRTSKITVECKLNR